MKLVCKNSSFMKKKLKDISLLREASLIDNSLHFSVIMHTDNHVFIFYLSTKQYEKGKEDEKWQRIQKTHKKKTRRLFSRWILLLRNNTSLISRQRAMCLYSVAKMLHINGRLSAVQRKCFNFAGAKNYCYLLFVVFAK